MRNAITNRGVTGASKAPSRGRGVWGLALGLALFSLSACASRDGISTSTEVSTGSVPVAGSAYEAYNQAADESADLATDIANAIIVAPFQIAESALGIDEYGRPLNDVQSRTQFTYQERLDRRRTSRGLPISAKSRVRQRQASTRQLFRAPATR